MGYLLDEITIPKEVYEFHNDTIKHYNFQRAGAEIGMCSKCGTYQHAENFKCINCKSDLIPKKVTKRFNPDNYNQETACEIFSKYNGEPYYSYIITMTSLDDNKHEITLAWEVERITLDKMPGDKSIVIPSSRQFNELKWFKNSRYADYYCGNGQKKFRTKRQIVPKHDQWEHFFDDTDLKYTCIGKFFQEKFCDTEPENEYKYILAQNIMGDCWVASNWPYVEMFWKMGFKKLYEQTISKYEVDMRMLTKKNVIKYRKELKDLVNPTFDQFLAIHIFSKEGIKINLELIKTATRSTIENYVKARKLTGATHGKVWRYLNEVCQGADESGCWHTPSDKTTTQIQSNWIDYLGMVLEIEGYIEGKKAFPLDPVQAHDDILRIKNALKNELRARKQILAAEEKGLAEMMAQTIEEYNLEKLEYVDNNGLMIIAMKSIKDIVDEGAKMNHCVGGIGFIEEMAKGRSFIFSIRKTEKPDVPVGTIEYKFGRGVVQCQGYDDKSKSLPEGYKDTLERWQDHIKEVVYANA